MKTLADHVFGKCSLDRRAGRESKAGKSGFPITKSHFLLKVGTVVHKLGLKTQFKNWVPGEDYRYGLNNRRPDIAIRVTQNSPSNWLVMMTRPVVNRYFDDLGKLVTKLKLEGKPGYIWNCNETNMQHSPDSPKVVSEKGERSVYSRYSPSKESVTTLVTINASSQAMPPLCVGKGKTPRALHNFATQDGPEGIIWSYQAKAWMCDDICLQWFRTVFLAHCGSARPQLLILDSHYSHDVLDMLELAQKEDAHVMALSPHTVVIKER